MYSFHSLVRCIIPHILAQSIFVAVSNSKQVPPSRFTILAVATTSIIAAVMTKFDALTAGGFPSSTVPPIYLDEPPVVDGTQIRPPYVVLRDNGQTPVTEFERTTIEGCEFTMEVYYPTAATNGPLADVDTAVNAIKRNGGTVGQGLGFDYGTLTDLTTPRSTHVIRRVKERRAYAGFHFDGKRVYVCYLDYRVEVKESP